MPASPLRPAEALAGPHTDRPVALAAVAAEVFAPARSADRATRDAEFRQFYATFYPRLARYCYRLVRDAEQARDLAQESFACLLARWIAIRDPEPYLFHVATNLVRTVGKRARRETEALAAAHVGREERVETGGHTALHLAVDKLPTRYRELVMLYYFADLPIGKVAAAVRRPEGTVKRQLAEARSLLAAALGDVDAELG